jgi:hypothetical protein
VSREKLHDDIHTHRVVLKHTSAVIAALVLAFWGSIAGPEAAGFSSNARMRDPGSPVEEFSQQLQRVGTLTLQADDLTRSLASLCEIVVMKNRITPLFISVLDRPPGGANAGSATRARK